MEFIIKKDTLYEILQDFENSLNALVEEGKLKRTTKSSMVSIIKGWLKTLPKWIVIPSNQKVRLVDYIVETFPPKYHRDKIVRFLTFVVKRIPMDGEKTTESDSSLSVSSVFEHLEKIADLENFKEEFLSLSALTDKPISVNLFSGREIKGTVIGFVKEDNLTLLVIEEVIKEKKTHPFRGNTGETCKKRAIPFSAIEFLTLPEGIFA